jgi:glycosidase
MQFITNHDENSWKESVFDRYGDLVAPLAVLTFTIDGMPLIYSGQEVGMDKSLAFFDKDEIDWKESEWTDFYQKLIELNKTFPPLWNGIHGAEAEMLESPEGCLYFRRSLQKDTLEVLLNFTDSGISLPAETQLAPYMKSAGVELSPLAVNMPAQSYLILTSQN